jgi:serine protease AprX
VGLFVERPRRRGWMVVSALVMVSTLAASPAFAGPTRIASTSTSVHGLDPGLATTGQAPQHVIVTGTPNVADAVRRLGGQVTASLPIVSGVGAVIPAARLRSLASDPNVWSVTADRVAHLQDFVYDDSTTASNFTRTTQATSAWAAGDLGQGIGVAVIDTGVSPMADLTDRLVHGPDLSGEGTTIDTYGHGTVMAGIIAGSGSDSANLGNGAYTGVAPEAHIVAVKVAGQNGVVDVSTMLQAMTWVAAYRDEFNIRVLNLSWGVSSTQDPAIDPLDYAVERLWSDGIVVVVAAGNDGPTGRTITKPADDPVVLTVGAFNDHANTDPSDDSVPGWSSRGPTAAGVAKPDLVAPGRTLIATRSFGSYVEQTNPSALISPSYIRGSGTSEAAAVTSGVVALLLEARPDLTPDQVKDVLTATASPIGTIGQMTQGAGRIQLVAALGAVPTAPPQPLTATGLGSLEASRGGEDVTADCNGVSTVITGEMDVQCNPWEPQAWTSAPWNGDAWTGVSWKGAEWDGVSWKDVAWSDATWDGVSWKGGTWTSDSWQGSSSWDGATGSTWTGVSWKGATWAGVSWKDASWTGTSWTSTDDFLTAFWGSAPAPGRYVYGEPYTPLRPVPRRRDPRG